MRRPLGRRARRKPPGHREKGAASTKGRAVGRIDPAHSVEAEVGDRIEVLWLDGKWYPAKVIAKRQEQREIRYHLDNLKTKASDDWVSVNSTAIRTETTDDNTFERYMATFDNDEGHIDDDLWEVDRIEEERGDGDNKSYLVSWHGWAKESNSWVPRASIVDRALIDEFEVRRDG